MTDLITPDGKSATTFSTKVQYFLEKQTELMKMQNELQNKAQAYNAEMKAWCGICDGDKLNILDLLKAVRKVTQDA